MHSSFYGGPQGKDFRITHIFNNKKELVADLEQRQISKIPISSIVVISYGLPNGEVLQGETQNAYEKNSQIDLDLYRQTYNATYWIKLYLNETKLNNLNQGEIVWENPNAQRGFAYKLIASTVGLTPSLEINSKQNSTLNPLNGPQVIVDSKKIDNPIVTLEFPDYVPNINVTRTKAGESSEASLSVEGEKEKKLRLDLAIPEASKFFYLQGLIVKHSNSEDSITVGFNELSKEDQQIITDPSSGTKNLTISNGDYVITSRNGNIYKVLSINQQSSLILKYQACLAAPIPNQVQINTTDPFEMNPNDGSFRPKTSYSGSIREEDRVLSFNIPAIPKFEIASNKIGLDEIPRATTSYTNKNTVTIHLDIPKGSRIYTGSGVPDKSKLSSADAGDYYLDVGDPSLGETETTGNLYLLKTSGDWEWIRGNLRGRTFQLVKIPNVPDMIYIGNGQGTDVTSDDLGEIRNWLNQKNTSLSKNPSTVIDVNGHVGFSLTHNYITSQGIIKETYHYFYLKEKSSSASKPKYLLLRELVTGNLQLHIRNRFIGLDDSSAQIKSYSCHYINRLFTNPFEENGTQQRTEDSNYCYNKAAIDALLKIERI